MKKMIQHFVLFVLRGIAKGIGHILFDVHISGKENIPASGGALVVANHVSYLDFLLILITLPRHASFVMNADVFHKPVLRFLFESVRCIPISPRGGKNNFEDFNNEVTQRIRNGEIVVIFAEGTVTRTGQLLEFKKGVEHIARLIEQPIIPIQLFNASGSPFTFKAGVAKMQKIRWNNLRRPVFARVGTPLKTAVTAFELRQKIKELEVENLQTFLNDSMDLPSMLQNALEKNTMGGWAFGDVQMNYTQLKNKLRSYDQTLGPVLSDARCVALLAPKSVETMSIMVWLILRRITIVPLPDVFNNEEQLFAINKSKAEWLITTRDLNYTRISPTADQIIYIEDLNAAEQKGQPVPAIYSKARGWQQSVLNFFRTAQPKNELAFVLFHKEALHASSCTALSYQNVLAAIQGIRQVYFFEKASVQLSDIPHSHAHGLVMELLLPLLHDVSLHVANTRSTAEEFIANLTALKPSLVIATPTQLDQLARLAIHQNLPYITHVFTAGLHPNHDAVASLRQRGIEVFVCAGLNETSSVFAINLNDYQGLDIVGKGMHQENQNENSIGKALPGVAIRISNPSSQECAPDEIGMLWIKGPGIAHMHHTSSECVSHLENGWLNTGIMASMDRQGFINIHTHH
jgi:acyl-[acyl-carrier-protein]-phospholipid O-acyltransferase / long-chain-fatty-acid--[acyl-carrier-protein] ligase